MNEYTEYVRIDDKYYDPYFILEVDKEDDLEYIIKAYKYKAKKYHPDKAKNEKDRVKNEKRFKILRKSIEFIKEKRENAFIDTHNRKKEYKSDISKQELKNFKTSNEIDQFNDKFLEKVDKKKFENTKNTEPRDKNINVLNQFTSKKFENDKFNLIFDYNLLKNKKEPDTNSKQVVHYTTDGFFGYNTSDLDNYAIVRSFNGLLISDDMLELDNNNYGNNYSDYNHVYNKAVKNPNKIIKLTKEEEKKIKEKIKNKSKNIKKASDYLYENESDSENDDNNKNNFNNQQNKLYKKNLKHLIKQQENDKNIIINSKIYDNNLIKDAENEILDMSPSLLRALDEHYKFKRLT